MLVDDAAFLRQMLKDIISNLGHDVFEAVNGKDTVDPTATVIMCSAMGQQHMVIDAIQAGAKTLL